MPKAHEVATELRKLADSLDQQPEAEVVKPWITFYGHEKDSFLTTARLLPRPLKKRVEDPETRWARLRLENNTPTIDICASIEQSKTCTLITPARAAVYECDPILSPEEDAELIEA